MRVVDARNGFTHLALARSRDELQSMASATGCAVLLIRNAHHLAALWPDIEDFAAAGFVAFACVTSRARVTAWGGDKPVFGTNASAFACPRADGPPITWDQAASVMSHGDLMLAAREGRAVPEGVGVDAQGRPTSDAKAILDGGALSPFGGVKGASIAFMVEILASALSGSVFGFESPAAPGALPSKCGEFILLLDPRRASGAIGERVVLNQRRGWDSDIEAALFANAVDRATLDAMHDAVGAALPHFRRYLRATGLPALPQSTRKAMRTRRRRAGRQGGCYDPG